MPTGFRRVRGVRLALALAFAPRPVPPGLVATAYIVRPGEIVEVRIVDEVQVEHFLAIAVDEGLESVGRVLAVHVRFHVLLAQDADDLCHQLELILLQLFDIAELHGVQVVAIGLDLSPAGAVRVRLELVQLLHDSVQLRLELMLHLQKRFGDRGGYLLA